MAQITLNISPSGEGCEHIEILNDEQAVIETITFSDLGAEKAPSDSSYLKLLKDVAVSRGTTDPNEIKAFIDNKNLWGIE
jgi:hypothetical protein